MKPTPQNDVPNNYFESLEAKLMARIHESVSTEFPDAKFEAPSSDYFESFEKNLLAKLEKPAVLPEGLTGNWSDPGQAYFEQLEVRLTGKKERKKSNLFAGIAAYGSVGIAIAMSLLIWSQPKPQTSIEQQLKNVSEEQKAAYLDLYFDGDVEQVAAHVPSPSDALIETTQKIDDQVIDELDLMDNL